MPTVDTFLRLFLGREVMALLAIQSFSPTLIYDGLILFTCLSPQRDVEEVSFCFVGLDNFALSRAV